MTEIQPPTTQDFQEVKQPYFSTFQLILIALFSALIVVAKITLRLPLSLPGHSGVFWMAIVIIAAGIIPKFGTSTLIGLTSGLIASFIGLGDFGIINTFLSYFFLGLFTDLALALMGSPEKTIVALIAAPIGHIAKLMVKWIFGLFTGVPVGFVATGLALSAFSYVLWGALGGLLGTLTLSGLRKAGFFTYLAEKR